MTMETKYTRYFKVCPRGFVNEVTYYRISNEREAAQAEAEYGDIADRQPGASAGWTDHRNARRPGVAVKWADRNW
jgi:hypothetical protein